MTGSHIGTAPGARGIETLSLREWLAAQARRDDASRVSVGACGHLLLSRGETQRVRRQLVEHILPALAGNGETRLSLFVGMAPGADLLFLETASRWLRERGLPFEMTALLPVPVEQLINDWALRAQDAQLQISRATLKRLAAVTNALLQECTNIVPLYPERIDAVTLSSRNFRQQQYRRLASIIAQHADHLVAILRPQATAEPGGTAEVVAWHRAPNSIPSELRLHTTHCASQTQLHLIDPARTAPPPPSTRVTAGREDELGRVLNEAEAARRAGNELLCNDIVYRALKSGLSSRRLQYLRIQALANTGNVQKALNDYRSLDLTDEELDEDWLALLGRLEKDLALQDADPTQYARAAQAYLNAYQRHGGSYSAVNAASMLMLAGDAKAARHYAGIALERARAQEADDEVTRFYQLATEAEAALLLDQPEDCRRCLRRADRLLRDDIARRSRTRLQLRLLCQRLGRDVALLDALSLPPLVLLQRRHLEPAPHTVPTVPASLRRLAEQRAALQLTLHEPYEVHLGGALVSAGARVYLTLPSAPSELLRQWRGRDSGIAQRLQRLLDAAEGITVLRGFLATECGWAMHEAAETSHGLAQLHADRLGVPLQRHDYQPGAEVPRGKRRKAAVRSVAGDEWKRHMVGLIFADFASFRRLSDDVFPRYYREIMQQLAQVIDRHRKHVRVRQSWGDALHVVTDNAESAAHIVVEIQNAIEQRRMRHDGVLADMELRIAAHYAPAYAGDDPIEQKPCYYGTQLSFAARIEPVVPPGMTYVTETFAARLALEAPKQFMLDYAGEVELAKQFGTYRLYSLRRPR